MNKNIYKESTKQKAGSLKKINKIDKSLANLTQMRREKNKISKIRNKKRKITNTKEIQRIIRTSLRDQVSFIPGM
jgi:uncharacterized membrane protein YgaE (UPF0421/DUF939 family)